MASKSIVAARPDISALVDAPIRASWILAGEPVAKLQELSRSNDRTTLTAHWSCTAGTFNWYFGMDETVHILEGEVIVQQGEEAPITLRAGDVALFHCGTWSVWHVPVFVRKICICRHALPAPTGFLLRAAKALWGRIVPVGLDRPPVSKEAFTGLRNPNLIKPCYDTQEAA
jgi:uncharacterized protein